ncbi:hypothetical protein [Laceyella putida]|uniref:Uncharacterized protein n=1 Tax=Laceyella putida TaxID=110101 RepID=A0ABW2RRK7_9BACL
MRDIVKEAIFLRNDINRLHEIMYSFPDECDEVSEEEIANDEQIFAYHRRVREIGKQLTPEEMTELILHHGFQLDIFPYQVDGKNSDYIKRFEVRFDGLYFPLKREHWNSEQLAWMIKKLHASSIAKNFTMNLDWKSQRLTGSDNGLGDEYVGPDWDWRDYLKQIISNENVVLPEED